MLVDWLVISVRAEGVFLQESHILIKKKKTTETFTNKQQMR